MSENTKAVPTKVSRHGAIARILSESVVRSQVSLQQLLQGAGFEVTQATLSRDLEELGATKIRDSSGNLRYAIGASAESGEFPLPLPGTLEKWCQQLLIECQTTGNQVVARTPPAAASALASAIDRESFTGVLGCVAGDDTVLIICAETAVATKLHRKLREMAGR